MKLKVKVQPGASTNLLEKLPDGSIKVKLTQSPEDGKANKALLKLLSKELNITKSRINIISGLKSKEKLVEIK